MCALTLSLIQQKCTACEPSARRCPVLGARQQAAPAVPPAGGRWRLRPGPRDLGMAAGGLTWQVASAHQAKPGPLADMGRKHHQCSGGGGGGQGVRKAAGAERGRDGTAAPARPAEAPVTRGQRSQRIGAWSRPPLSALWAVPSAALEAPGRWTDSCGREDRGKVAPEPGSAPQGLPAPPSAPGGRAGSERTGRGPGSFLP